MDTKSGLRRDVELTPGFEPGTFSLPSGLQSLANWSLILARPVESDEEHLTQTGVLLPLGSLPRAFATSRSCRRWRMPIVSKPAIASTKKIAMVAIRPDKLEPANTIPAINTRTLKPIHSAKANRSRKLKVS